MENQNQVPESGNAKKWLYILPVIAAVVIIAIALNKKDEPATVVTNDDNGVIVNDNDTTGDNDEPTSVYADGEYFAEGEYISPGGEERLPVTLTLEDGVITEAEVTVSSENPMSQNFQTMFVENYKSQVIGKKIDEVELDKVSGSSLAPIGFNDAVEQIKEQATS